MSNQTYEHHRKHTRLVIKTVRVVVVTILMLHWWLKSAQVVWLNIRNMTQSPLAVSHWQLLALWLVDFQEITPQVSHVGLCQHESFVSPGANSSVKKAKVTVCCFCDWEHLCSFKSTAPSTDDNSLRSHQFSHNGNTKICKYWVADYLRLTEFRRSENHTIW